MKIELRLDYATMNFDAGCMSAEMVGETLAGDNNVMCWTRKGLSENAPIYSPLGVRWTENNGWQARPHKLEVSGVGCEKFALTLANLREKAGKARYGFSRLDFAFDVLIPKKRWKMFICRAFESSLNCERERKKYHLAGTGEAMTIYIGSRRGSKYFRIYNKTLEDPNYPMDSVECEGNIEEFYIIRYEVELKRVLRDHGRLYDPSQLFECYYSNVEEQNKYLVDYIKSLWVSFGDDVLLPGGFNDAEWTLRILNKTKNFVQSGKEANYQNVLEFTRSQIHEYPHSFERTLNWIVEKLGKYIPYVINDKNYLDRCITSCKNSFGFVPGFEIIESSELFYDIEDDECPFLEIYDGKNLPYDIIPEQLNIGQYFEREVTHWDEY